MQVNEDSLVGSESHVRSVLRGEQPILAFPHAYLEKIIIYISIPYTQQVFVYTRSAQDDEECETVSVRVEGDFSLLLNILRFYSTQVFQTIFTKSILQESNVSQNRVFEVISEVSSPEKFNAYIQPTKFFDFTQVYKHYRSTCASHRTVLPIQTLFKSEIRL